MNNYNSNIQMKDRLVYGMLLTQTTNPTFVDFWQPYLLSSGYLTTILICSIIKRSLMFYFIYFLIKFILKLLLKVNVTGW